MHSISDLVIRKEAIGARKKLRAHTDSARECVPEAIGEPHCGRGLRLCVDDGTRTRLHVAPDAHLVAHASAGRAAPGVQLRAHLVLRALRRVPHVDQYADARRSLNSKNRNIKSIPITEGKGQRGNEKFVNLTRLSASSEPPEMTVTLATEQQPSGVPSCRRLYSLSRKSYTASRSLRSFSPAVSGTNREP